MKTFFICPKLDGHYKKYFEVLSEPKGDDSLVPCTSVAQLGSVLRQAGTSQYRVILLAGDAQIPFAIRLCLLGRARNCTSIIYYTHFQSSTPKTLLKMALIRLIGWFGVKVLFLEGDSVAQKNRKSLPDLIDWGNISEAGNVGRGVESEDASYIRLLVFGYIEARKCIAEVIESIDNFSTEQSDTRIELRIIGAWDRHYRQELSSILDSPRNYSIVIVDEYINEDELIEEIRSSSCVIAIYRDHFGSSGVVNLAIANSKCVVFVPFGYLGTLANTLSFENLPASSSVGDISNTLTTLHQGNFFSNYSEVAARDYVKGRSAENFRLKING